VSRPASGNTRLIIFIAAHIVGGVAMRSLPALATVHFVGVLIVVAVVLAERRPERLAQTAAYVACCDVLWRMTSASAPYEIAKYLFALLCLAGFLRVRSPRRVGVPLLFLVLLIPSAVLTVSIAGIAGARDPISFNLSGPFALVAGVLFFSQFELVRASVSGVVVAALGPIAAVAAIASASTVGVGPSAFSDASNFATSGGFGPNQVSALLGLGALLALALAMLDRFGVVAMAMAIWFLAQAALTFSRGGVTNVFVGLVVALYLLARAKQVSIRGALALILLVAIAGFGIVPRLQARTGGQLVARFGKFSNDGRTEIAQSDLQAWYSHPLLGVGVGQSSAEHERELGQRSAPHTEFSRLLAEHGAFGATAILCLVVMAVGCVRRQPSRWGRPWAGALLAWSLTEMAHSDMRICATAFVFGIAACRIVDGRTARRPAQAVSARTPTRLVAVGG
jgi:hypothetical protein